FLTPRFVPSELVAVGYLQFFEQYAQSMSLWSPDSSAFAYPGMNEDGEEGIWIQSARPDRAAVLVAAGAFVAWSPVARGAPSRIASNFILTPQHHMLDAMEQQGAGEQECPDTGERHDPVDRTDRPKIASHHLDQGDAEDADGEQTRRL